MCTHIYSSPPHTKCPVRFPGRRRSAEASRAFLQVGSQSWQSCWSTHLCRGHMCGPQSPEASEGPSITADLGHSLLSHYRAVMQWSPLSCANTELFYHSRLRFYRKKLKGVKWWKWVDAVRFLITAGEVCRRWLVSSEVIMSNHLMWRSRLCFWRLH